MLTNMKFHSIILAQFNLVEKNYIITYRNFDTSDKLEVNVKQFAINHTLQIIHVIQFYNNAIRFVLLISIITFFESRKN